MQTRLQRMLLDRLPVRDDVKTVTYHRNPTQAEIHMGYGAIHYREFNVEECLHKGANELLPTVSEIVGNAALAIMQTRERDKRQ